MPNLGIAPQEEAGGATRLYHPPISLTQATSSIYYVPRGQNRVPRLGPNIFYRVPGQEGPLKGHIVHPPVSNALLVSQCLKKPIPNVAKSSTKHTWMCLMLTLWKYYYYYYYINSNHNNSCQRHAQH